MKKKKKIGIPQTQKHIKKVIMSTINHNKETMKADKQIEAPSQPKCLCELCTCNPKTHFCEICAPKVPFDGQSSYNTDYVPKPIIQQREEPEPEQIIKSPPFTAQSTYNTDFIPRPLPKQEQYEEDEYKPTKVPFDAKSTYDTDFIARPLPKQDLCEPEHDIIKSPKFDAKSTYDTDYLQYPIPKCDCPCLGISSHASPKHQYYVKINEKWQAVPTQ